MILLNFNLFSSTKFITAADPVREREREKEGRERGRRERNNLTLILNHSN